MARHSKVFNALISFYKSDADSYYDEILEIKKSFEKEINVEEKSKKQKKYEDLKFSIFSNYESIVALAEDQANHFMDHKLIKDWECEMIISDIMVYCDKKIKSLKTKKVLGPSKSLFKSSNFMSKDDKMFEIEMILEDINNFQI